MPTNSSLMHAILSMDAYNRGYDAKLDLDTQSVGNAEIMTTEIDGITVNFDSQTIRDEITGEPLDFDIGFYALAYEIQGGETIISYRGTDNLFSLNSLPFFTESGSDIWNGYGIGAGSTQSNQAAMAIKFFQAVAGDDANLQTANISLTGHSLGGGLAGFVGGLYGKKGLLFDNMPFENAVNDTHDVAQLPFYDPAAAVLGSAELKQLIYGSATPWTPEFTRLNTIYAEGEFLIALRVLQDTPTTEVQFGDDWFPDTMDAHSMSALIIAMFGSSEVTNTDWNSSAQYFWPVLYDNNFASQIGFNNTNAEIIGGQYLTNGNHADILRSTIAYSSIDEGTTVFGNTAIRALYDDAGDLGKALAQSHTSYLLESFSDEVAELFIEFAGALALSKKVVNLEQTTPDTLLSGVLTYDEDDNYLALNFSDPLWQQATVEGKSDLIVTKDKIINSLLLSDANASIYRDLLQKFWGNNDTDAFENVLYAVSREASNTSFEDIIVHDAAKGNLIVANYTQTQTIGSNYNDFFRTGLGYQELYGLNGNDIFISEKIAPGLDGDQYYGGSASTVGLADGLDTVDYSKMINMGIWADLTHADNGFVRGWLNSEVQGDVNDRDILVSIESIIGTDWDDHIIISYHNGAYFDGGDGTDTLNLSPTPEGIGAYMSMLKGFENVILTAHDDTLTTDSRYAEYNTGLRTYDAGNGFDTLHYDNTESTFDANTGIATLSDTNVNTFLNFESYDIEGGVYIPSYAIGGNANHTFNNALRSYETHDAALTFDINYQLDYDSNLNDQLVLNYQSSSVTTTTSQGALHSFGVLTTGSANAVADIPADFIDYVDTLRFKGSNHGDTYNIETEDIISSVTIIETGTGNDTITFAQSNELHLGIVSGHRTISYSGGLDTISGGHAVKVLSIDAAFLGDGVDITYSNYHSAEGSNGYVNNYYDMTIKFSDTDTIVLSRVLEGHKPDIGIGGVKVNFNTDGTYEFDASQLVGATAGTNSADLAFLPVSGDTTYYGFGGDDDIRDASSGNHVFYGGSGYDLYYYNNGLDIVNLGTDGGEIFMDAVYAVSNITSMSFDGETASIVFDGGINELTVENVIGSNTLLNFVEEDSVFVGYTISDLLAQTQPDIISGTDGDDNLITTAGDDIIEGGAGYDTYNYVGGMDVITDSADGGVIDFGAFTRANLSSIEVANTTDLRIVLDEGVNEILITDGANTTSPAITDFTLEGVTYDLTELKALVNYSNYTLQLGTEQIDDIYGTDQDEIYIGLDGDDNLTDFEFSNDVYVGGAGEDSIYDEGGDDTYVISVDGSFDYIGDYAGNDTIVLAGAAEDWEITTFEGFTDFLYIPTGMYELSVSGDIETITYDPYDTSGSSGGGTDPLFAPVTAADFFTVTENEILTGNVFADNGNGVDFDPDGIYLYTAPWTYTAASGSTFTLDTIGNFTYTPAADYVGLDEFFYQVYDDDGLSTGTLASFTIEADDGTVTGTATADTLTGSDDDDILIGGAGDDTLNGGAGNDSYVFEIGHGTNTINETSGFDVLTLGAGITLGDLTFTRIGNDLDVQIASGFLIKDFFSGDDGKVVEQIAFSDGSTFDLTSLISSYVTIDEALISGYSGDQDQTGTVTVTDNGNEISLTGNIWKKMDFDYDVTNTTVLEFDFKSDQIGEIHGIGIDTDNDFHTGPHPFALYGTQDPYYAINYDYNYTGSGEWQSMRIELGSYMTGAINYLTFINDNDDASSEGHSAFRNIRLYEDVALSTEHTVPDNAPELTFSLEDFEGYTNQDTTTTTLDVTNNDTVHMVGDNWKALDFDYEITENSYLSFDFKSTAEGELSGFIFLRDGLDPANTSTDNLHDESEFIRIYGTQSYNGIKDFYTDNSGDWQTIQIKLTDYHDIGDQIDHLVFVNDDDEDANAESYFANIQVYERNGIYGNGEDNFIIGTEDADYLYGADGADLFIFDTATSLSAVDTIADFDTAEGDALDLSDLIAAYDPVNDAITDFIQITDNGSDSVVAVDVDGLANGSDYVSVATIKDVVGLTDEDVLVTNGNLIAA